MSLRKEINRIGHLLHNGVDQTQKTATDWVDKGAKQGRGLARRVQGRMDGRSVVNAEEALVRHVRENPALYLIASALLVGALIAKLLMQRREIESAPLL